MDSFSKKHSKQDLVAWIFILPAFTGFVFFMLVPIVFSLYLGFTDFNLFAGFDQINFLGIKNYTNLLKDDYFIAAIQNNIFFTVACVPVTIFLSLLLANALNKEIHARGFLRALIFMPYITTTTAISIVFSLLYNAKFGPINELLRMLGVINPPDWLTSTQWSLVSVMILWIWRNLGYFVVIFLAGLQSIDQSLYEAANIDGASTRKTFMSITIPLISPTTFFLLITGVMDAFKVFAEVKIMTNGGPGNSSMVMVHHIYRTGFEYYEMGYASAISWAFFVLIFIITILQWVGQKKWVKYV